MAAHAAILLRILVAVVTAAPIEACVWSGSTAPGSICALLPARTLSRPAFGRPSGGSCVRTAHVPNTPVRWAREAAGRLKRQEEERGLGIAQIPGPDAPSGVDRRTLLGGAVAAWAASPGPAPAAPADADEEVAGQVAERLAAELAGVGDVRWRGAAPRFGTSTLAAGRADAPEPQCAPLAYPPWMAGEWNARYTFDGAKFPRGRGALSLSVPGAGLATCLAVPNVGKSPFPFRQRYLPESGEAGGACFPDVAFNVPRLLEAFWNEAHTSYIQVGAAPRCYDTGDGCTGPERRAPAGNFTLCFLAPTRRGPRVEQRARSVTYRSESARRQRDGGGVFLAAEDVVQLNVEQGLQCLYRTVTEWRPTGTGGAAGAAGKMRVAAFLPAEAAAEVQKSGEPDTLRAVALYDYSIVLTPPSADDEAWLQLPRRV